MASSPHPESGRAVIVIELPRHGYGAECPVCGSLRCYWQFVDCGDCEYYDVYECDDCGATVARETPF